MDVLGDKNRLSIFLELVQEFRGLTLQCCNEFGSHTGILK